MQIWADTGRPWRCSSQAVKIEPDHPDALNKLGAVYGQMGKYKEVSGGSEKIGRPQFRIILRTITAWQSPTARWATSRSRSRLRKRRSGWTRSTPRPHGYLGLAYASTGMYREAASEYKTAIRLDRIIPCPTSVSARYSFYERKTIGPRRV